MEHDEERYADGFAEYRSLFGGPFFDYVAPTPLVSPTIAGRSDEDASYSKSDSSKPDHRTIEIRKEAGSLPSASLGAENEAHSGVQPLMVRISSLESGKVPSPLREAPPPIGNPSTNPDSEPPTNEFSQTSSSECSQAARSISLPCTPKSSQKQVLRFSKFLSTAPPTPPMLWGSSDSNADGHLDRMQYMYSTTGHPRPSSSTPELLKVVHDTSERVTTANSTNSHRTSRAVLSVQPDLPDNLYQLSQRDISSSTMHSVESKVLEMSASNAQAEISRRLSRKNQGSDGKGDSFSKKGFILKSAAASTRSASGPSQNNLTDILEEVAAEGSLPLVEAAIGMGADPIHRSTGKLKKVKHEALAKATSNGRAKVVDYLLREGANYGKTTKSEDYTPLDRALSAAAYKGHADLADCLLSHGANPLVKQWPKDMHDAQHYWNDVQVRVTKASFFDALSKWKNEDRAMSTLKLGMQHQDFDPTALVCGVFDNKSQLQSAGFPHRPWQTTYEYSVLSCFTRAGWADAVEEMLSIKGLPEDYEKDDDVLQHHGKSTRFVSPINAMTKETWDKRPEDALRILRLLIHRGFNLCLTQQTATDLGPRTAFGRALSADAAQAVELILQTRGHLIQEDISFRRNKRETKVLPLPAALSLGSLETARVLLRAGAHPRDLAFENMNALQLTAYENSATNILMLEEMISLAPELAYDAVSFAVKGINKDAVRVLLNTIPTTGVHKQVAALPPIYDMLLHCTPPIKPEAQAQYLELIDMVVQWDLGYALQRPQLPAILSAIRKDNYIGMERLLHSGVVDGRNLVLNSKAQPCEELGTWTVLECCELTDRSSEWLGLLRSYGAPLYH
jgi:hypothetical protein